MYQNLFINNKHIYKITLYNEKYILNDHSINCGIEHDKAWMIFFFLQFYNALMEVTYTPKELAFYLTVTSALWLNRCLYPLCGEHCNFRLLRFYSSKC